MINRWTILMVLFLVRLSMAFQFQAVAALSPLIVENYLVDLAQIGLLIGLYLGPGIIVAIPGGSIAARFGDKRVVALSLVIMLVGGAMALFSSDWSWLLAGRLLAGIGGVIINVVLTKMLIDWFAGHEIGTAMALFVVSWPAGISLALLTLPGAALVGGLAMAWGVTLAVIGLALILFLVVYRAADGAANPVSGTAPGALPMRPILMAGLVWGLYNTALIIVVGFGPLLLTDRGASAATAAATMSIFIIFIAVGIPLGGILADRTGRRDAVIATSLVGSMIAIVAVLLAPLSMVPLILFLGGIASGLCAGPIMALPSSVLAPAQRALGMGIYFTLYYIAMMVGPAIAGRIAEYGGQAEATFVLAIVITMAALLALMGFRQATRLSPAH